MTQTDWLSLIRSGEIDNIIPLSKTPPLPEKEPHPQSDFIEKMYELGTIYGSGSNIKHNKQDQEKWSLEKKMAHCPRNGSSNYGIRKGYNGLVTRIPHYCNHCAGCYEANTLKLKTKVESAVEKMAESDINGQWYEKVVDSGKEASSLKKHIKRNENGRHLEMACEAGKVKIWTYVENKEDASKNEAYGKPGDPLEDTDFEKLYKENRSTGKKLSRGSGFKSASSPKPKEDTERVTLPDIVVKDGDKEKAAEIIANTNFIKEAKSADEAKRLYAYQFDIIIKKLEEANIKISAIKMNFFNMDKETIVNDWNNNVRYWMSINSPLLKDSGAKVDTSYLVYPKSGKKDKIQ